MRWALRTHTVGSQKRIVLSFEPDAMSPFWEENATEYTAPCGGACAGRFEFRPISGRSRAHWVDAVVQHLVPREPERSQRRLEVPDHDAAV